MKIENRKKSVTRLLFIKRRWRDAILSGEKTIELRDAKRYSSTSIGDEFLLNGRERIRVIGIKKVYPVEILANRELMRASGFRDAEDASRTFADCGIDENSVLVAFWVAVLNGK